MKKANIILLVVSIAILGKSLNAQDEKIKDLGRVVVTGNRFETPIEKSGKVIYKITEKEISKSTGRTVADMLNLLPGINVNGAYGTPGTNLEYSLRGGRNRHTLILIDGLPINDPSLISNDYDLRLINLQEVEFIEVLKGGASTLYGTNAAAGVINIKLKSPEAVEPEVNFVQQVGSFQSLNTNVNVQAKTGKLSYLIGGSFGISEGISAASSGDPSINFGNDGFYRYTGRTRLSYDFSEQLSLSGNLSYEDLLSDYDGGAFFDQDNQFDIRQLSLGLNPKYNYQNGSLQLKYSFNRVRREFISDFPFSAKGFNTQADLSNEYIFSEKLKTIIGVQYQDFSFENEGEEPNQYNIDPYLHLSWDVFGGLTFNGGIRLNTNSEYGTNLVYSINPSYLIDLGQENQLKLFGSYSTAYITPSLFQLFSGLYGNLDLQPEETASVEGGLSLYLGNKITLNAEYFQREETNAIDFVSLFDPNGNFIGGEYQNIDGTREINGIELDITYSPTDKIKVAGHFADYQFGDPSQFYRIPAQKHGLSVDVSPLERTQVGLVWTHFGERTEAIFTDPFLVDLAAYDVVDLTFSHQLFEGLSINGAVYNLLDEDFVSVYGFNARPVNFSLGVSAKF